jgi:hypothetical protein
MKKNIIFFLNVEKNPSGGRKIIYQFSNFINKQKNFTSSILHVEKKKTAKLLLSFKKKFKINNNYSGWDFKELKVSKKIDLKWYNEEIIFKNSFKLNSKSDFVILPEIFAHFADDFLIKKGISYAIFVQNGYAIFPTNNRKKLNIAYNRAKYILSYSKNIDRCIIKAFPECKKKIIKVIPAINASKLKPDRKQNLITYMPRKLFKHSELLLSFLERQLPKRWKLKALINLNEEKVFYFLRKSKIFMSFSDLEGLGMPPIEAAIAGNQVIGYTGEAGKEYWKKPIFTEIKNGELLYFCEKVIQNLKNKNFFNNSKFQRNKLAKKYSLINQNNSLINILKNISK